MRATFLPIRLTISLITCLAMSETLMSQGIFLPAGGAVNRGMGGATTGAAIEAVGSMYWNPATISRFERDQLGFGFELIAANQNISSTFPLAGSGSTDAETGWTPVPTIAWVHQTQHPDITFGLGIMGVGGFAFNAPPDLTNPLLATPLATGGTGLGGIRSEAQFFEVAPAFSFQMTERLSIAVGPRVGLGRILIDENAFAPLNADGTYPRGDGSRYHWGLGFQIGAHYAVSESLDLGVNFKSPMWFETFEYQGENELGQPRQDELNVDLPLILTTGLAYRGLEHVLLTADFRFLAYSSADGLGDPARYLADGRVDGLGWKDQFSLGLGAQVDLTERLTGRLGYIYATNLFDDSATFFNTPSDLSYQHVFTTGGTLQLNDHAALSAAYNFLLPWESTGPYDVPGAGVIPGSSVSTDFNAHILTVGLNVQY